MRPTDLLTRTERADLIGSMRPEDAERVPELHEVDVPPGASGADRVGDGPIPAAPLGLDPGALGGPAPLRLVHAGRHPPGGRGDGPRTGLPPVGSELLRPLPPRADCEAPRPRLPQHLLLDARRRRRSGRVLRSRGLRPPRRRARRRELCRTTSSSSRASSAWARATSPLWSRSTSSTTGRSSPATRSGSSNSCEAARSLRPNWTSASESWPATHA